MEILLSLSEAAPPRKAAKHRRSAPLPETRKDAERRHRAPVLSPRAVSVPRSRPLAGMLWAHRSPLRVLDGAGSGSAQGQTFQSLERSRRGFGFQGVYDGVSQAVCGYQHRRAVSEDVDARVEIGVALVVGCIEYDACDKRSVGDQPQEPNENTGPGNLDFSRFVGARSLSTRFHAQFSFPQDDNDSKVSEQRYNKRHHNMGNDHEDEVVDAKGTVEDRDILFCM